MQKTTLIALDFESVLVPEIWPELGKTFGINELKLTTRDIADFDVLMRERINALHKHNLKLADIESAAQKMEPFEGAKEFLDWLRVQHKVLILSHTYYEFLGSLMPKLNYPTICCYSLVVQKEKIVDYKTNPFVESKANPIKKFQKKGFRAIAVGDSYNDIDMLQAADEGILFNASQKLKNEYPQFSDFNNYKELKSYLA